MLNMRFLKQSRIDRFFKLKIPSNLLTNGARYSFISILILYILSAGMAHHQMRTDLIYHRCLAIVANLTLFILFTLLGGVCRFLLFLFRLYCVVSLALWSWAEFTVAFHSLFIELFANITIVILYFCFAMWTCICCY